VRPADMYPYDYAQEMYSSLHYVTEGVTTYYGDLMIWKGGTWDDAAWLAAINNELDMFYRSGGKNFTSLEAASMDSWVRGYNNEGIPNRKISFYTKGYLAALCLDMTIRKSSANGASLDTVMRALYQDIAKQGRGYTREDFNAIAASLAGQSLDGFWEKYITGLYPFEEILRELCDYYGFEYKETYLKHAAAFYGLKITPAGVIENILEGSPAVSAGLAKGDEIVAVGGFRVEGNLNELLNYHDRESGAVVHYFHRKQLNTTLLHKNHTFKVLIPQVAPLANPSAQQLANRTAWRTR